MPERHSNKGTRVKHVGAVAGGLAFAGMAISGAGFGHANAETKLPTTSDNQIKNTSNINIDSVINQDSDYANVAAQMDAIANKNVVKVVIDERGESLTQATSQATGKTLGESYEILKENGLDKNNLVYVQDEFEVTVAGVEDIAAVSEDSNIEVKSEEVTAPEVVAATVSTNAPEAAAETAPITESVSQMTAANLEAAAIDCVPTDLKGTAVYSGNHISGDPVQFDLQNVQPEDKLDCPDGVWIRSYASNQNPNSAGWLESQSPINSQIAIHNPDGSITRTSSTEGMVTIPNNTDHLKVVVDLPDGDYCWAQVETVRTSDLLQPPYYNGDNMVDYALVSNPTKRNPDTCEVVKTPTATPTNTATSTATFTATAENTSTSTPTPSETPSPTLTPTATSTEVPATSTSTMTPTATSTEIPRTGTATNTVEPSKTSTATMTPSPTATSTEVPFTATATNTPTVECFDTDRKGTITYTGNHVSGDPVLAHLENVGAVGCSADFYVDIFGSDQKVTEGAGWLESQHLISQEKVIVEPGTSKDIVIDVPNLDDCYYQVDLGRTNETRADQLYGIKMIDYAFVKDVDSCLPTATATNTATSTATFTPTATNTPETPTSTVTRTKTPIPPTSTNTPEETNTATSTSTATNTPESTPTEVVVKGPDTGYGPDNSNDDKSKSIFALMAGIGAAAIGGGVILRDKFSRRLAPAPLEPAYNLFEQRLLNIKPETEEEKKKRKHNESSRS